jgi:hypothetical protein
MFLQVVKQTRAKENGEEQCDQIHAYGEKEGLKPSEIIIGFVGFHTGNIFKGLE